MSMKLTKQEKINVKENIRLMKEIRRMQKEGMPREEIYKILKIDTSKSEIID